MKVKHTKHKQSDNLQENSLNYFTDGNTTITSNLAWDGSIGAGHSGLEVKVGHSSNNYHIPVFHNPGWFCPSGDRYMVMFGDIFHCHSWGMQVTASAQLPNMLQYRGESPTFKNYLLQISTAPKLRNPARGSWMKQQRKQTRSQARNTDSRGNTKIDSNSAILQGSDHVQSEA